MKQNKKAVLFDLDGTVLDTISDIASAVNRALAEFGFPQRSVAEVQSYLGNGSLMLIRRATGVFDNDEQCRAVRARFREEYEKDMCNLTVPYQGMTSLMAELSGRGVRTAVVTNKDHRNALPMIEHYFGSTVDICRGVCADDERKPNPKVTLEVLSQLGVTPEEAVFVGDGFADLQVSANAGIDFLPVGYGYTAAEKLYAECGITPVSDVCMLRKKLFAILGLES